MQFKGKNYFLGYFYSKIEAAFAYDQMALEKFGEFANLNFPESIEQTIAAEKIKNSKGRIIKVAFNKRTDNNERVMLCRTGVSKFLTGKGMSFDPSDHNLIIVFDMAKKCFRALPVESIKALWMDKQKYKVA